jgi:hypothetical protein
MIGSPRVKWIRPPIQPCASAAREPSARRAVRGSRLRIIAARRHRQRGGAQLAAQREIGLWRQRQHIRAVPARDQDRAPAEGLVEMDHRRRAREIGDAVGTVDLARGKAAELAIVLAHGSE